MSIKKKSLQMTVHPVDLIVPRDETQAKLDSRSAAADRVKPRDLYTTADRWEEQVEKFSHKVFLYYADQVYTYQQANEIINQYAQTFLKLGLRTSQTISICLENRPHFYWVWFAAMKLGLKVSFLNTNLKGLPLEHAVKESESLCVVVGDECIANFDKQYTQISVPIWRIEDPECTISPIQENLFSQNITRLARAASIENPDRKMRAHLTAEETALYIFTSGTTGLPKAAITSHMRWMMAGAVMEVVLESTANDVFYCFLPLYHGAAATSLTSTALVSGAAIALRRKFSLSQFWNDVRKYGVTSCQYVGEICRYLLSQPESPDDRGHTLVKMTGTGLTKDNWHQFINRFGIKKVYESWGSTEGNANTLNFDNRIGSCGRVPYWEKTNLRIVKYDQETNTYPKNEAGFFIPCEPGEVGEAIAYIVESPLTGGGRFEGYTSKEATEKKILRNVFSDGDKWWSSGDLLKYDEDGYCYFVDRIGDTFRWKSENVSTLEVQAVLEGVPEILFSTVYGVEIPGYEGRAGMVALMLKPGTTFDAKNFYDYAASHLPRYAMPQFVRINKEMDMTGTYKLRKVDLQKQSYNPDLFDDQLFVIDEKDKCYVSYSIAALEKAGFKELAPASKSLA